MNKREFIERETEKNRKKFGRWGSSAVKDSAIPIRLLFEDPPRDREEVLQHCNALFDTGSYPIVTDGCFNVGIAGGCGPDCFVYLEGECEEPQEMLDRLETEEEFRRHRQLYGEETEGNGNDG